MSALPARLSLMIAALAALGCEGALLAERTVEFAEAARAVPSPGRGFLRFAAVADADLAWVAESGDTLIYGPIRLDPTRNALPEGLEAALDAGFASARAHGVMVVARAVYNDGFEGDAAPDAPLDRMRGHIAALGPILSRNADVLLAVQAGLIGAWGEWHGSANGHDAEARRAVVDGWLAALPETVPLQVRTPAFKIEATGDAAPGAAARIGHHNDCFLSSETDVGTYPAGETARWLDWLEVDTADAIFGGETCALHPRNACPAALDELARLHVSFLNRGWHPDVIERWRTDGCLDDIEARLGHRLVFERATWPESIVRGDRLPLAIDLRNDGFAPPRLPWRAWIFVVDDGGAVAATWPIGGDLRRWAPGGHRIEVAPRLDIPPGRYTLEWGAWHAIDGIRNPSNGINDDMDGMQHGMNGIPDDMPSLDGLAPRFGLRLANAGVWRPESGRNRLGVLEVLAGP